MTPFEPARAPQGASGFLLLAHDTDLKIYTPNWHEPTYFLPVGSPQQDLDATDDDNWYHRVPDLVRLAGTRQRISFLNTPSDIHTDEIDLTTYDLLRQSAWIMSNDTHPRWHTLFRSKGRRRPAFPNPTWSVLMQGMLYGYPKMAYWRAPIGNALLVLSPSVAMAETLKTMPRHLDGRIFHGPRGGTLKPDTVRNILVRDVITPLADRFPRVGDEPAFEDGRVHSLRHYFCSACADSGVSEQMLMT